MKSSSHHLRLERATTVQCLHATPWPGSTESKCCKMRKCRKLCHCKIWNVTCQMWLGTAAAAVVPEKKAILRSVNRLRRQKFTFKSRSISSSWGILVRFPASLAFGASGLGNLTWAFVAPSSSSLTFWADISSSDMVVQVCDLNVRLVVLWLSGKQGLWRGGGGQKGEEKAISSPLWQSHWWALSVAVAGDWTIRLSKTSSAINFTQVRPIPTQHMRNNVKFSWWHFLYMKNKSIEFWWSSETLFSNHPRMMM